MGQVKTNRVGHDKQGMVEMQRREARETDEADEQEADKTVQDIQQTIEEVIQGSKEGKEKQGGWFRTTEGWKRERWSLVAEEQ